MRGRYYRPIVHHTVRVTLDKDGLPATWRQRIVTQSIMKGSPTGQPKFDDTAVEGTKGSPYPTATPVVAAPLTLVASGVPVLWWRPVGATPHDFGIDAPVDKAAPNCRSHVGER